MKASTEPGGDKNRYRGVVINFMPLKGYGFIRAENGKQIFVHYSDIRGKAFRTLISGEEVEFNIQIGSKGPQAVDVVRLDPPREEDEPPLLNTGKTW
ncbi:MAG TPA: cold shock domain-containing protein [Bacteroidetes bacterium]|nr:cold shock domain-containing protein [Bacteroidota bacterium]